MFFFTAEAALFTDTKIKGKSGGDVDSSMDRASITVWVNYTDAGEEKMAYPGKITLAERIQTLQGRLSECTVYENLSYVEGDPIYMQYIVDCTLPEWIELILETTSANGFNFLAFDVSPGVHDVTVYATIETAETEGAAESGDPQAAIGSRTLVVEEVRLIQDGDQWTSTG